MTALLIILGVFLGIAVFVCIGLFQRLVTISEIQSDAEKLNDSWLKETTELTRILNSYKYLCHNSGVDVLNWEIFDFGDNYGVCKRYLDDSIGVIARRYYYDPTDIDDKEYKLQCAEELVEKLNEIV